MDETGKDNMCGGPHATRLATLLLVLGQLKLLAERCRDEREGTVSINREHENSIKRETTDRPC